MVQGPHLEAPGGLLLLGAESLRGQPREEAGPDVEEFHKTTFQDPPDGALISEGAAAYRDADTARRAFGALVSTVGDCARGASGQLLVGDWTAKANSLHLAPGGCGRDYRVASVAMLEVTFCGFPQSVSDIVMTNIAAKIPG